MDFKILENLTVNRTEIKCRKTKPIRLRHEARLLGWQASRRVSRGLNGCNFLPKMNPGCNFLKWKKGKIALTTWPIKAPKKDF